MPTTDRPTTDDPGQRAGPAGGGAGPASVTGLRPMLTDQLDSQDELWHRNRRLLLRLLVAFSVVTPFLSPHRPDAARIWFLAPATAAFIVMADRIVLGVDPNMSRRTRLVSPYVMVGLAVGILAAGGPNWVAALIIAGAAVGRLAPSARAAGIGTACCVAAGLGVSLVHGLSQGNGLTVVLVPATASLFAYAATRRNELVRNLRETRAELARMAVADERLPIARDLHDLLGHSLSLITLKAELAGRVVGTDPDRAAREIADLEAVARRSLGEVRAAVTSYRQPSLAAELAAARQMLAAAGMEGQVHAPESFDLAPETEALLAWTVREGVTNVVRHSGARTATIIITVTGDEVAAEVTDDGAGPAWDHGRDARDHGPGELEPGELGSGLAGLAERARAAGAGISAGEGRGGNGFRLRVRVPAGRFSVS